MEKAERRSQNNVISDENFNRLMMIATAKKHVPNVLDEKSAKNERKEMNEDKSLKPKKCRPLNYFFKTHKNIAEQNKNNDEHIALADNDEIEDEEEDETKATNKESKMKKEKVVKNNKKQVKTSNKKKH